MSRLDLGYLLLAILVASVAGGLWYAWYNSQGAAWKRGERKRQKRREKRARVPAE